MEKVYLLYSCDAWKSYASMHTIGVFTDLSYLQNVIDVQVEKGIFTWTNTTNSASECTTLNEINETLEFGYVEEVFANVLFE